MNGGGTRSNPDRGAGSIAASVSCLSFYVTYLPMLKSFHSQGDPFDDSVLLWTRAVPINGTPDQSVPVCVSFRIFNNAKLTGKPIDSGEGFTTYDVDFTVKFEATKLKPDTQYWFEFADCTNPQTVSPVGATRTISSANSMLAYYCVMVPIELMTCF